MPVRNSAYHLTRQAAQWSDYDFSSLTTSLQETPPSGSGEPGGLGLAVYHLVLVASLHQIHALEQLVKTRVPAQRVETRMHPEINNSIAAAGAGLFKKRKCLVGFAKLGEKLNVDNIAMESLADATYPCPYSQCNGAAILLPIPDKVEEMPNVANEEISREGS